MKKIFLISLPLLFVSLFICSGNVEADTYTYPVPDSMFTALDNNLSSIQSIASDYMQQNNFTNYLVVYGPNFMSNQRYQFYYFTNINNFTVNPYGTDAFQSGFASYTRCWYSDTFVLSQCNNITNTVIYLINKSAPYYVLYSSFDFTWNMDYQPYWPDAIFSFTNGDNHYDISFTADTHLPTVYTIKQAFTPPPPEDNYPILTSFITTVLEKISLICEYFSSNYIFLTIFVIFIFYFVILLFRRLK